MFHFVVSALRCLLPNVDFAPDTQIDLAFGLYKNYTCPPGKSANSVTHEDSFVSDIYANLHVAVLVTVQAKWLPEQPTRRYRRFSVSSISGQQSSHLSFSAALFVNAQKSMYIWQRKRFIFSLDTTMHQ